MLTDRVLGLTMSLALVVACGGDSSDGALTTDGALRPDAGSLGGSSGDAGSAGAAGQGGAAGAGGDAGAGGAAGGAAGAGGTAGAAGTAGASGAAGAGGSGTGGAAGASAGTGGLAGTGGASAAGTGGTDTAGTGGSDTAGTGGTDTAGTGGTESVDGGVVCPDTPGYSDEPGPAVPTGGETAAVASLGDCPPFAPVPLGNQQWAIVAVRFQPDDSADVYIQNVSGDVDGFGDLFSVCNEQPNCVFVHSDTSGLQVPAGGLVLVNVPNTVPEGGELAIYTNNLSFPHPIFCDLLGRAFSFHIVQWGTGPSGEFSLLEDAIRDFDWWTPGDLITIGAGDTGFSAIGDTASEDGYTSCNP